MAAVATLDRMAREDRYRRTLPWHPAEMLLVDGIPCVYTTPPHGREGEIVVHRHGRMAATVATLRAHGHSVTIPASLRLTRSRGLP